MVNKVLSWPSSPKLARGVGPVVATQDDLLKGMGLIREDVKREVRKPPRSMFNIINVRYGSKADIPRRSDLRPLLGVKQT